MSNILFLEKIEVTRGQKWGHDTYLTLTFSTSSKNCVQNFSKILLGLARTVACLDCIYEVWSAVAWKVLKFQRGYTFAPWQEFQESLFLLLFPFNLSWVAQQWPVKASSRREAGWGVRSLVDEAGVRLEQLVPCCFHWPQGRATLRVLWFWKFKL